MDEQTYHGVQHNKAVRGYIMRSLAKGHNNSLYAGNWSMSWSTMA
ncbi:hypothetical protein [Paenibacillus melissococcoides]|nr:hypothetical protein [Paenibacillus melissococcoides]